MSIISLRSEFIILFAFLLNTKSLYSVPISSRHVHLECCVLCIFLCLTLETSPMISARFLMPSHCLLVDVEQINVSNITKCNRAFKGFLKLC